MQCNNIHHLQTYYMYYTLHLSVDLFARMIILI